MKRRLKRIFSFLIFLILCLTGIPGVCEALPDSHIIYLYVPACESCARAVEILDRLPESVTISHPGGQGESRVRVERVDVSQSPETARQLYIHRNTLVYRLDKLQKTTNLDLRVFEDAITFKIALMVVKYMTYMENAE